MISNTSRAILKRRSYAASQDLSRNDLQSERQTDAGNGCSVLQGSRRSMILHGAMRGAFTAACHA